jgi:thiosulfate dehydrogenase (quinone) large subunit
MAASDSDRPNWGLVLIRIAVGWILIQAGWMKITGDVGPELVEGTQARVAELPFFARWWMEHVVLAAPALFAFLIQWGELAGGVALFLGALTRPAGLLTAFMFANFYFAGPPEARSFVLLLAVCCFAFAWSRAGQRLGLDEILDQHFPSWITWTRAAA